ncbi:MAG: hypothetical protein WC728_09330 [Elusimicrobiota bacterium]
METLIAVCLVTLTLTHLAAFVFLAVALLQVKRSAEAVEILAYRAREQVETVGSATRRLHDFAGSLSSNWVRTLALGLSAAFGIWSWRRARREFE